jgi:hypothetical protein
MDPSALQDFYRGAYFVMPDQPRTLPQREGDAGAGRGLEAAEEVAVAWRWPGQIPWEWLSLSRTRLSEA